MNNKIKYYGLQIILLIILFITLILDFGIDSRIKLAIFLLFYSFLVKFIIKKNRTLSIHEKTVLKLMIILSIIYVALLYTVGIYTGFYKSTVKFSILCLKKYIIPISIIICASEYIRTKFLNYDTKLSNILSFLIQLIIDVLIYSNVYRLNSVDDLMLVIGYVLFASISCNLLYNYISKRYGMKPNIIFRLITTLYVYLIPVSPDIYIFFLSFYRMIYPYIIYYVLDSYFGENEESSGIKRGKLVKVLTSICFIILLIYIALISCMFKYGVLVIGSGSMTGTIDKGDVIFFSKDISEENTNVGDIIVYTKDDVKVVHRVIDKKNSNGNYKFYTKGDANKQRDKGYVTKKNLYAKVLFKIDNIGRPTLWLHDIFENKRRK